MLKQKNNSILVSVIIAIRNEEKHIAQCIETILNQTHKNLEIIVIDGNSTDSTIKIIKRYSKKIKILQNKEQKVAQGRNIGFNVAKGKYICFIDGHSYADTKWVETLLNTLIRSSKKVGAVGSVHYNAGKEIFGIATTTAMNSLIGGGSSSYRPGKKLKEVKTSYACMYRKEVLESIKNNKKEYYDPYFVKGQDAEMNLRIIKKGYKILQQPKAITYYYKRSTIKGLWNQMVNAGFWRVKIVKKHPETVQENKTLFAPTVFFLAIIISLIFKISRIYGIIVLGIYLVVLGLFTIKNMIMKNRVYNVITFLIYLIIHVGYSYGVIKGIISKTITIKDRIKQ